MVTPIIFPSRSFPTKKAAFEYFRKMLHSYADGDDVNQNDQKLLIELLHRHHDEVAEKIGNSGVKRIYRDAAPDEYATSCFWIERNDGTHIDFSFYYCLKGIEKP